MNTQFTAIFFCILFSFNLKAQIEVWHQEGDIELVHEKTKKKKFSPFKLQSIIVKDTLSYVCIVDRTKRKLLEINAPGNYPIQSLDSLLELQITLPDLRSGNLQGGKYFHDDFRPAFSDWVIFPNLNEINVSDNDTVVFTVLNKKEVEKTFLISDYFGDTIFTQKVNPKDTVNITIDIQNFTWEADFPRSYCIQFQLNCDLHLTIITNGSVENHREKVHNLLLQNSRAYISYALLYLFENNLAFDAIKLIQARRSEIESFFPPENYIVGLNHLLGYGFVY